nr:hypothetical protein [Enterococcus sp. DIV2402]MBO0463965.1 hypothetical protein [Enterococcus sp. DIV2402]
MKTIKMIAETILFQLQESWIEFGYAVNANRKKTLIRIVITAVLMGALTLAMLTASPMIRKAQIDQLIINELPTEQIIPFSYEQGDREIKNKAAISVMFTKPNGEQYDDVMALLSEKSDELNRKFYYYPIVYDADVLKQQYNVEPDKVTFIFFQNGVEKNRFTLDSLEDAEQDLVPELNRLPMFNIQAAEKEDN